MATINTTLSFDSAEGADEAWEAIREVAKSKDAVFVQHTSNGEEWTTHGEGFTKKSDLRSFILENYFSVTEEGMEEDGLKFRLAHSPNSDLSQSPASLA